MESHLLFRTMFDRHHVARAACLGDLLKIASHCECSTAQHSVAVSSNCAAYPIPILSFRVCPHRLQHCSKRNDTCVISSGIPLSISYKISTLRSRDTACQTNPRGFLLEACGNDDRTKSVFDCINQKSAFICIYLRLNIPSPVLSFRST